eukprot:TRINITY_DN68596_c0_g1_i1.p1 TRINITY_DN68596_c0_g1~~TRINITY_DN68596_c0_g1_i1.p1  ORF type:complete len:364 (-),score=53.23 TRINITY_DN68596_c0_g1_i1:61-1098(-)
MVDCDETLPQHDLACAALYPEEHIFLPSTSHICSHELSAQDLLGRALSRTSLPPSIVQQIIYFVCPNRIWLARIPFQNRRLLKQDFNLLQIHLQNGRICPSKAGFPVSLFFGAPGIWALHLPDLGHSDKPEEQEELFVAHRPEEFALTVRRIVRYSSALRTLRVVLHLGDEPAKGPRADGAAALLFASLARGDLARLNHLTVIHVGGDSGSCFSPLARSHVALKNLRTLRLSLAEPHLPLKHLTAFALVGGFPSLESVVFFGEGLAEDEDMACFVDAIARSSRGADHPLSKLDIRASHAGAQTAKVVTKLVEEGRLPALRRRTLQSNVIRGDGEAARVRLLALLR